MTFSKAFCVALHADVHFLLVNVFPPQRVFHKTRMSLETTHAFGTYAFALA